MKVTANGVGIRYDLAGPPDAPVVTLAHSLAMARVIHERIAGSRLASLPGAMHCSSVEADQAFNAALLELLAGMA